MLIRKSIWYLVKLFLILILSVGAIITWQENGTSQTARCTFAPTSQISSVEQAKCLLRPVLRYGNLGATLTNLASPLNQLLSQPTIELDKETLRRYLNTQNIRETDIGSSLEQPVSRSNNNSSSAELARYFIIHDTSTPNFENRNFPGNIDEASWSGNDLQRWTRPPLKAHVFINRLGDSVTAVNFRTPWRATKYELDICGQPCKGLFLNVETVQPRRSDPQGRSGNDAIAPNPGFTDAQLDRLALVYIAASVRRGKWLIPAFHACVDAGYRNAHDDPQNFDLERWASRLNGLLEEIGS